MNRNTRLLFAATTLVALSLDASLLAQPSPRSAPMPGAPLTSPRIVEEFPALVRTGEIRTQSNWSKPAGLSTSPRALEQYPALSRVGVPARNHVELISGSGNRAFLAAPRTLEQFPSLLRGGSIAETSTTKRAMPGLADVR